MGKSALLGNVIADVCDEGGEGILFSLEMPRLDIVDRLCAGFHVKYQNIRSGNLSENDWPKLTKAAGRMHEWKFHIDDTPAISLREIRAKARKIARSGELKILGIDYLQLMGVSDPRMNRNQAIGEISRGLKQLAKELWCPIVLLSQLNRGVDARADKRPVMSDLRESGEIEQDADVILFPYRPSAYCEKCRNKVDDGDHNCREHQAKAEVIIEKQRSGERNLSIPVAWVGEFQRFESLYQE
jgi:replicative DNA helicase